MPETGGIATDAQNDKLKHSQGGLTTRDDALDAGAPMLAGSPDEPVGPEDAFGEGPKRGDYRERLANVGGALPHIAVRVENPKPGEPHTILVPQVPRANEIGDAKGQKGGVDTDPLSRP